MSRASQEMHHHMAKVMSPYLEKMRQLIVAMNLCTLIYNKNQGISFANGLIQIVNIHISGLH